MSFSLHFRPSSVKTCFEIPPKTWFLKKENFQTLHEYLFTLSREKDSINKWNIGGQIYSDFIRLKQRADVLFSFSQDEHQEVKELT